MRTTKIPGFLLLVSGLAGASAACGGGETDVFHEHPEDTAGSGGAGKGGAGGGSAGTNNGGKAGTAGTAGTGGAGQGGTGGAGAAGKGGAGAGGASGSGAGGVTAGGMGGAGTGGKSGQGGAGQGGMSGAGTGGVAGAGTGGVAGAGMGGAGTGGAGMGGAGEGGAGMGGAGQGGAGEGGAGMAGAGMAGVGGGPQCQTAIDCPAPENLCIIAICDAGQCAKGFVPPNTPTSGQKVGDCQVTQCDGSGNTSSVADDTDLPDDKNDCTDNVCTNGVPSNPPFSAGAKCGATMNLVCDGAGVCAGCLAAADCQGQDTDCAKRTCIAGSCGVANTAAGTPAGDPTAGDCKSNQCDGNGGIVPAPAATDLPVDGDECTSDVCTSGTPSNPLAAAGTPCTKNGGAFCNDTGACVACINSSDCPGTDSECQARSCTAGVCGFSFTAAGTAVASQTAGDCQRSQCDGAGKVEVVEDNLDVPADSNPCTSDVCTDGVPSNPPAGEGSACGQNGLCNATGVCVGCIAATDCPGMDNECQNRTCAAGVCGFSFVAVGTPVASQTAADCKKNQCNGAGAIVNVPDATDLPVDGNQCTSDVCTNGTPSNPPVSLGTACGAGGVCSATGTCVQCVVATTCPGADNECQTRTCNLGVCGFSFAAAGTLTAAQTAGDCKHNECNGAGTTVNVSDNTDLPVDNNQCTSDLCVNGTASNPPLSSGAACNQGGGSVCNGTGTCAQCVVATTCPGTDSECQTRTCTAGTCGFSFAAAGAAVSTQTAGDCKKNQCNGSGAIVNVADNNDLPVDGNTCTGDICTAGVPSNPAVASGTACGSNGMCNASGMCVGCVTAATCPGMDNECQTRTCTAGACGFSFVAAGTAVASQTAGDCKKNQCNGSGVITSVSDDTDVPVDSNQCTSDVCTLGTPSNPPLGSGAACNQTGGSVCSGTGTCVQCVVATTCPGADNECQTRTCTAGTCGFSFASAGTAVASQTAGDCKKNQCDGSGMVTSGADGTDLPVDGNQCTSDVCTTGTPSNPSLPVGTACNQNGGNGCDNTGACSAAPTVTVTPSNGTNALATSDIVATFSNAMNPATLTAQNAAGACSGSIQVSLDDFATCIALPTVTVAANNLSVTLKAAPGLLVNRTYKIRVTTAATNAKGLALQTQFTQAAGFTTTSPNTCSGSLVISQVYGGSGSAGATYKNDFVELHNRGASAIDLSAMSIQYASSAGTSWNKLDLAGSIPAGGYFLIQLAAGVATGAALPAADLTGNIDLSGSNGKVALVSNQTVLMGSCPLGAPVLDFAGYGTANCFEGSAAAPAGSATTGVQRAQVGCGDGDTNSLDFTAITPAARNSVTAPAVCACVAQNESNVSTEADFCTTLSPLSLSVKTGVASALVVGQIYELGVSEAAGANAVVRAQLGYGPVTANPEYEAGWVWAAAPYKAQNGNNDDYQTTFIAPAVGTYRYAYRMSLDSGVSWTYCDNNQSDAGAGSNPNLFFELKDLGVLTVTP